MMTQIKNYIELMIARNDLLMHKSKIIEFGNSKPF